MSFKRLTNQTLIAVLVMIGLVIAPAVPLHSQTRNTNTSPPNPVQTLTQTTLSAAVDALSRSNIISVTSATGFTVGNRVVIISPNAIESADILSISSTAITLNRGIAGTARYAHNSGDTVYTQRPALFFVNGPHVPCVSATTGTGATAVTTSTTTPTPWVDQTNGDVWYCASTSWFRVIHNGLSVGTAGSNRILSYTVAGALFLVPGVHSIGTAGALAMTLAPPTKDMDGMIMIITSSTAQAHTVTYTAGFSQTTTSSDVATFGGAVNDGFMIQANAGVWNVISTRNVTIA